MKTLLTSFSLFSQYQNRFPVSSRFMAEWQTYLETIEYNLANITPGKHKVRAGESRVFLNEICRSRGWGPGWPQLPITDDLEVNLGHHEEGVALEVFPDKRIEQPDLSLIQESR